MKDLKNTVVTAEPSSRRPALRTSVRAGDNPGMGPYGSTWSCKVVPGSSTGLSYEVVCVENT